MTATDMSELQVNTLDGRKGLKGAALKAKDDAAALMHQHVEPLVGQAMTFAGDVRRRAGDTVNAGVTKAREKPFITAAAALGVGLCIGAALALTLRRPASQMGGNLRELTGGLKTRASDWTDQLRGKLKRH